MQDEEKPYKLSDGGGLYLEVAANGGKYWRLKYRISGKEKRLAIGVYPIITLGEAREARDNAKKLLANNIDPSLDKKKKKQNAALQSENTFEKLAREWHSNNADKWSDGHRINILHRLEMDIFPVIGNHPIVDIAAPELLQVLRKIESRGAREIAHRAKQTCGQILRYAIATGRAVRDPSNDLQGALKPVIHKNYSALAHAPISKIDRAYDRTQFIDERKKMMQEWSDYLDKIIKLVYKHDCSDLPTQLR